MNPLDDLRITHDWPEWAAVEVSVAGRTTTLTAVPGRGMSWNVMNHRRGWGCDSGVSTTYSDTTGPICCSPLTTLECLAMVRALGALVDFLEAGAEVPVDPDAQGPVVVLDWEQFQRPSERDGEPQ